MANLVNANAANATQVVNGYAYNRSLVKAGILHFGVGNFHRAHLEFMTNMLLENNTQQNWGICGAMILPGDERLYHALKKQDGEYTLTVCGRDDSIQVYQLGALVELYWGIEEQEQILDKIASKDIKIITLTITEGQPSRLLPLDMLPRDCVAARQQAMVLSPSFPAIICSTMAIQPARHS